MKGRSLLGLIVSLAILIAGSLAVLAQSQRYPTPTEMQRLRQQLRQRIRAIQNDRVAANSIKDDRTQAEKENRQSFVRAWSNVEPEAALFFGSWSGFEHTKHIYPSNVRGRVCVLTTTFEGTGIFSQGVFSDSQINASDGEVIFKEGNYLGVAKIDKNKPVFIPETLELPLNSPRPLKRVTQLSQLIAEVTEKNTFIQQFNAAGCTTERPNRR